VLVESARGLDALDPGTGAVSWKHPRASVSALVEHGGVLAVFGGDGIVRVLDAPTGRTIAELAEGRPTWDTEVAVADGVAYGVVRPVRDPKGAALVAIDLGSGKRLWKTETIAEIVSPPIGTGGVAVASGEVVFCTVDGTLRGVDRATGRATFAYGLGTCDPLAAVRGPGGLTVLVAHYESTEVLDPGRAARESVTVSGVVQLNGQPLAKARVMAHGEAATTDASGRYTLKLQAAGRLVVQAQGEGQANEKCDAAAQGSAEPVALDGRHVYTVDVEVRQNCTCGL
jgi:hypothetical protein